MWSGLTTSDGLTDESDLEEQLIDDVMEDMQPVEKRLSTVDGQPLVKAAD